MDLRGRRPFVPRPMGGVDWKRPRARIFLNECSGGTVEAGAREFERPSKPRPCLTPRVLLICFVVDLYPSDTPPRHLSVTLGMLKPMLGAIVLHHNRVTPLLGSAHRPREARGKLKVNNPVPTAVPGVQLARRGTGGGKKILE